MKHWCEHFGSTFHQHFPVSLYERGQKDIDGVRGEGWGDIDFFLKDPDNPQTSSKAIIFLLPTFLLSFFFFNNFWRQCVCVDYVWPTSIGQGWGLEVQPVPKHYSTSD